MNQHIDNHREVRERVSRRLKTLGVVGGSAVAMLFTVATTAGQDMAGNPPAQPAPEAQASQQTVVEKGTSSDGTIKLMVNKNAVVTTLSPYKRLSVGQPEIADVNPIGPSTVLITGKKVGSTQVIVWDDNERSQVIDVTVGVDLEELRTHMSKAFPGSDIRVEAVGGSISLTGRVPNVLTAEQAVMLATPYGKVMNFLEVSGGKQVMLKVRFAEVSRSAKTSLGFRGFGTDGTSRVGWMNGPGGDPVGGVISDVADTTIDPAVTVFGAGQAGSFAFEYFIEAMRNNNLLRMLAEPNLVAISGQEASFLAGGEFPIPVSQGDEGITVEFREFGVRLRFVPIVLGDGRMQIRVSPEVSELDFSTAVQFNGFVVPGLNKRTVNTTVELAEGQTFAIAGLLNNTTNASKSATPLLGDLPVLGALFRSVRYERRETELVVLVTPYLVEAMNPSQVPPLPGEHWRHPKEIDLLLGPDLGGPAPENQPGVGPQGATAQGPAPKYHGQYGFTPAPAAKVAETPAEDAPAEAAPAPAEQAEPAEAAEPVETGSVESMSMESITE